MASEWFAWATRKKDAHCFPFLFQCLMEKVNGSSLKVTFYTKLTYYMFIVTFDTYLPIRGKVFEIFRIYITYLKG